MNCKEAGEDYPITGILNLSFDIRMVVRFIKIIIVCMVDTQFCSMLVVVNSHAASGIYLFIKNYFFVIILKINIVHVKHLMFIVMVIESIGMDIVDLHYIKYQTLINFTI